jgi:hypothetical protein
MTAEQAAAGFDADDRPLEAARAYEAALADPETGLETFLNLAVLYFVCTDPGYFSHHHLSNTFIELAWRRANAVLTEAETRFGSHPEIEFWRRYFSFVRLGDKPFTSLCEQLAMSGTSLVPYLHLFTSPAGERYREKAEELLKAVERGATAKERYIRSGLSSNVFRRRKRVRQRNGERKNGT